MADILLAEQSVPTTPSAGNGLIWVDSTGILMTKDDAGRFYGRSFNASVANQTTFAADTYVTGSNILIPTTGFQAKSHFLWTFTASKTAAGTAAPIYTIRIGTAATTGDTLRLQMTGPVQTAIADIGTLYVMVTVRSVGAGGILQGAAWWDHTGTAASSTGGTGFANDGSGHVQATSAAFDNSGLGTGTTFIGLSINGGASASWTATQCWAKADW